MRERMQYSPEMNWRIKNSIILNGSSYWVYSFRRAILEVEFFLLHFLVVILPITDKWRCTDLNCKRCWKKHCSIKKVSFKAGCTLFYFCFNVLTIWDCLSPSVDGIWHKNKETYKKNSPVHTLIFFKNNFYSCHHLLVI